MSLALIKNTFKKFDDNQIKKFEMLEDLYREWNEKINVISRKDMDYIYLHHVLHSLALLKFYNISFGTKILDLGTGGGFPGIPLAIALTGVEFVLIDARAKKIKVINDIIEKLELNNVKAIHKRAEECKNKFDYIVSRAVAPLDKLRAWSFPLIKHKNKGTIPNGMFVYKGGDINKELKLLKKGDYYEINNIGNVFSDDYFKEKYLIYIQK